MRLLAGTVGLSLTAAAFMPSAAMAETTIIQAGQLLAEPGKAPLSPGTLVIEDGKVKEVRSGRLDAAALGLSGDVKVIDLSNEFVMPGFIDLHVHRSEEHTSEL